MPSRGLSRATHNRGAGEEKAPQLKSLQGLIFTMRGAHVCVLARREPLIDHDAVRLPRSLQVSSDTRHTKISPVGHGFEFDVMREVARLNETDRVTTVDGDPGRIERHAVKTLVDHPHRHRARGGRARCLSGRGRVVRDEQNSLYQHFTSISPDTRTQMSERQGADARAGRLLHS